MAVQQRYIFLRQADKIIFNFISHNQATIYSYFIGEKQ